MAFTFGGSSAGGGLTVDAGNWSLGDRFDAALGMAMNTGEGVSGTRTADTATTNAVQSMTPVSSSGSAWDDFWLGTAKTIVGYAVAKDAAQAGVSTPAPVYVNPANGQPVAQRANPLTLLLILGGLALALKR